MDCYGGLAALPLDARPFFATLASQVLRKRFIASEDDADAEQNAAFKRSWTTKRNPIRKHVEGCARGN